MKIEAPGIRHIPALRALWQASFGDDDAFLDDFFTAAFSPERCRCVMADDHPAAVLYWFDCTCRGQRIAYLYAVTTAEAYRRRGLCAALLADTHKHLQALGYAGVLLVPCSETLVAFYEKSGYRLCSRIGELRCGVGTAACTIREIGAAEYAARRREMLPDGGVVQEGENLRFLQTQTAFYAGDGFVLAASREGDTLVGAELLGNTAAAPAIVHALGCAAGRFRVPGERPFAMYRQLGGASQPPGYFGLAFD